MIGGGGGGQLLVCMDIFIREQTVYNVPFEGGIGVYVMDTLFAERK